MIAWALGVGLVLFWLRRRRRKVTADQGMAALLNVFDPKLGRTTHRKGYRGHPWV